MSIPVVLIIFSAIVILIFGHRQFNQWTDAESKREASEPELLAFAPPKNFTSFGRYTFVSALYCLTLLALYGILLVIFSNPPLGKEFLQVAGVTPENAWLVSLFIVTGLSPILPVFSDIERSVREVMHTWAFVPGKAHQMATEIASPSTRFILDEDFLDVVLPRLAHVVAREDFTENGAPTSANKWARLNYLLFKYAPPDEGGLDAPRFRSPYVIRFKQDLVTLQTEVKELAQRDLALLRNRPNSPDTVATADRIDHMLHRLYVLMSCRAFGSTRSWEGAVQYFQRAYGIEVVAAQGARLPSDPVFDALAVVGLAVFAASFLFVSMVPGAKGQVNPLVWALSALGVHGLGVLIGWKTFVYRKKKSEAVFPFANRLSREYLVAAAVLGYTCALIPTWLAAMYFAQEGVSSLPQLAADGFRICWPWGLFGAATAVATYFYLGRTANSPVTARVQVICGVAQGPLYLAISLLILATHNPVIGGQPTRTVAEKLADPVIQLVLVLTTLIGVLLGLFLPRILYKQGDDRRGGVVRHDASAVARPAVLTLGGRQIRGELRQVSVSGCVVRFQTMDFPRQAVGFGTVTLDDGTGIPARLVREVARGKNAAGHNVLDIAMGFSAERFSYLPKNLRLRLETYLAQYQGGPAVGQAQLSG